MSGYFSSLISTTGLRVGPESSGAAISHVESVLEQPGGIVEECVTPAASPAAPGLDSAIEGPGEAWTVEAESDITRVESSPRVRESAPAHDYVEPAGSRIDVNRPAEPLALERNQARTTAEEPNPPVAGAAANMAAGITREDEVSHAHEWEATYRAARQWVGGTPVLDEQYNAVDMTVEEALPGPGTAPTRIARPITLPAEDHGLTESSGPDEIHLSIGTISVVVEGPANDAPKHDARPPARAKQPAAADWTRLRRLYVR